MARFRKSVKIAPGVKLNLSKSGVSGTFGAKGASINVGKDGAYLNTGIPGTGIYDRKKLGGRAVDSAEYAEGANEGAFIDGAENGKIQKMGALGWLGGSMVLGGLIAFILFLFFPGALKKIIAAAIFIFGIVVTRIYGKREKAEETAAVQSAPEEKT
jgi:hypothetical protein